MLVTIKPNWVIARQVSRQHSIYSILMTLCLIVLSTLISLIVFKIMHYPNTLLALKEFAKLHQKQITTCILLVHLIPVNLYAIILTFRHRFSSFQIKLIPPDS